MTFKKMQPDWQKPLNNYTLEIKTTKSYENHVFALRAYGYNLGRLESEETLSCPGRMFLHLLFLFLRVCFHFAKGENIPV